MYCILGVYNNECLVLDTADKTVEVYNKQTVIDITQTQDIEIQGVSNIDTLNLRVSYDEFSSFKTIINIAVFEKGNFRFVLIYTENNTASLYLYHRCQFVGRQSIPVFEDVSLDFIYHKNKIRADVSSYKERYVIRDGWIMNLSSCKVERVKR